MRSSGRGPASSPKPEQKGNHDGQEFCRQLVAAEGQLQVARYLLAAGADPRPVDRWGGTPLTDAEAGGHTEIAALLRLHAEPPQRTDKREAAAV